MEYSEFQYPQMKYWESNEVIGYLHDGKNFSKQNLVKTTDT